jgi:hypothetical protein
MLGNLSKIGAVAATIMIPTALSAQMGGTVNPGADDLRRMREAKFAAGATPKPVTKNQLASVTINPPVPIIPPPISVTPSRPKRAERTRLYRKRKREQWK